MAGVEVTQVPRSKRRYVVTRDGVELGRLWAAPNGWQATVGDRTTVHLTREQATIQVVLGK